MLALPDAEFLRTYDALDLDRREELGALPAQRWLALKPQFNGNNWHLPGDKTEGADPFRDVQTASAIVATDFGPVRQCVDGRLPSGLVIMGGRPKAKKSWYALQLQIAKATGGQFMGVPVKQCRTLGIHLEDNDRRMKQRLEFFGITNGSAPDNLHLVYKWPTGLQGVERIIEWMRRYPDTGLAVIDVLQRFRGPRDPKASAYDGDYVTMGQLHAVTQQYPDLTLLVVHHVKKGAVEDPVEALNGTFAIAGAADGYVILRKGGEKDEWIAHIDGRDWASFEHEYRWTFVPQEGWRQLGTSDGLVLTENQREIIKYAQDQGYITPASMALWKGISRPSAHEALSGLVDKGAMRKFGGKYYSNTDQCPPPYIPT